MKTIINDVIDDLTDALSGIARGYADLIVHDTAGRFIHSSSATKVGKVV